MHHTLLRLALFTGFFTATLDSTAESPALEALWPAGKTPYVLPVDAESGSPGLRAYLTKGAEGHTGAAVLICPGGGYGGLAQDHEGLQPAAWFVEQGVSAYVLQYRLGSAGHHYPTQLADVQRALRTVRARAQADGLDPARIAIMGFSAGGHLASMAATLYDEKAYEKSDAIDEQSARPDLAILCYPVISLDSAITHGGSRKNLLGPDRAADDEWAKKLSSDLNVTAQTPPTFLFQTNADTAVPAENAARFYLALRAAGVPAEFHVYQDGPHGVGLRLNDPVLGSWTGLLKNWLKTNFFFAPAPPRVAVSGQVSLDGTPLYRGAITFFPENESLPATSASLREGKFSLKAAEGPLAVPSRIQLEGWSDATGPGLAGKLVVLHKLSPGESTDLRLDIASEMAPLEWAFVSQ